MFVTQSIQRPQGVNAFGTCLVRVDPDYVSIRLAVTRIAAHPKDAFEQARTAARAVRERIRAAGVVETDVRSSNATLGEAWSGAYGGERKKLGYEGSIQFHVILRKMEDLESLLSSAVEAGADRIVSVHPKTTRLKEVRREAREHAVRSARSKAEELAAAAGGKLGAVLHIEDVNADDLSRRSHMPDVDLSQHDERADAGAAENPGAINVGAAVMACFALA